MVDYTCQLQELEFRLQDFVLDNVDRATDHPAARSLLERIRKGTFTHPLNESEYNCFLEECKDRLIILYDMIRGVDNSLDEEVAQEIRSLQRFMAEAMKGYLPVPK